MLKQKNLRAVSAFLKNIGLGTLLMTAGLGARAMEPQSLLRPPAFSEISGFDLDFCGTARSAAGDKKVLQLCFGHVRFQADLPTRAVVLVWSDGTNALYVEQSLGGVELLKPRFGILGPVNLPAKEAEPGEALVTFDGNGEVKSLSVATPRWGRLSADRSR